MTFSGDNHSAIPQYLDLHLMDGTGSSQSYAAVARRGNIFLGIRFTGLSDGAQFGLTGKTYLHVRLRSARNVKLASHLDLPKGTENIVDLFQQQVALNDAWPDLPFEKVDGERASLSVGMFIQGSLITDTADVIARIQKGGLFQGLVAYTIAHAGLENCIVDPKLAFCWLADQAKPMLAKLTKRVALGKVMDTTIHEFETTFKDQVEVVGPYMQQFEAIFQKQKQVYMAPGP
jgi:hypothetical protein